MRLADSQSEREKKDRNYTGQQPPSGKAEGLLGPERQVSPPSLLVRGQGPAQHLFVTKGSILSAGERIFLYNGFCIYC